MKQLVRATVLVATVLISQSAVSFTGNELRGVCSDLISKPSQTTPGTFACISFVRGVIEGRRDGYVQGYIDGQILSGKSGAAAYQGLNKLIGLDRDVGFCKKSGQDFEQLARVVVKYMNDHPEETNQSAARIITKALSQAFPPPCD